MQLIVNVKKIMQTTLLILSVTAVMSCTATKHLPNYPSNLNMISLSDGGVCFDVQSTKKLAEFRAELENL